MLIVCFASACEATHRDRVRPRPVEPDSGARRNRSDWSFPHVELTLQHSPELFLAWQNGDSRSGVTGAVVVLGYVSLDQHDAQGDDLARTLLECWRGEGPKFLNRLEGSFSLFLHDAERKACLLATDPMSSRPLWYAEENGRFIVSSDLRQVAIYLSRLPDLDKAYVWSFLYRRCTVADRCFFEGIRAIEAGQAITFREGALASRSHYTAPIIQPDHRRSIGDTAAELVHTLRLTCQEALRGSRSPSLLLSGGLDSRLIAGMCPSNVTAVTLCDTINREVSIAAAIARRCGLRHRIICRDREWYGGMMEQACWDNAGLYSWNEAHFLPLSRSGIGFQHDVTMLGFACDTLFKGAYLDWPDLWLGWNNRRGPEPDEHQFVDLVLGIPGNSNPSVRALFQPAFLRECEEAFARWSRPSIGRFATGRPRPQTCGSCSRLAVCTGTTPMQM